MVPMSWIDPAEFFKRWLSCIEHMFEVYNHPIQKDHLKPAFERISANDRVDFGLLAEDFQKQIILRVLADKKKFEYLNKDECLSYAPGKSAAKGRVDSRKQTSHFEQL